MSLSTLCVIGLGYIGLPTAAIVASHQRQVIGVDISQHVVDTINLGQVHIVEPELEQLVHSVVNSGYLRATTRPEPADAFLIAVPTPFLANREPDLSHIEAACRAIAPVLKKNDLVILESTSPVGTTELMAQWLADARADLTFPATHGETSDVRIAHCPERVLPGHILRAFQLIIVKDGIKSDEHLGMVTMCMLDQSFNILNGVLRLGARTKGRAANVDSICPVINGSNTDVGIAGGGEQFKMATR